MTASRARPEHILGGVSLVIWAITIIVSIKYALLVLRAQNEGRGRACSRSTACCTTVQPLPPAHAVVSQTRGRGPSVFGDGLMTPAISVLSAVEGLHVAAPKLRIWSPR